MQFTHKKAVVTLKRLSGNTWIEEGAVNKANRLEKKWVLLQLIEELPPTTTITHIPELIQLFLNLYLDIFALPSGLATTN